MPLRLLATLFMGCFLQLAMATQYSISAEYITMQEGLSDNNVNAILRDQYGFIWFGTSDGLNRFDGFNLKSFYPSNSSLHVTCLYQRTDGYLLIGSTNGLHIFDPKTESFLAHHKLNPSSGDSFTSLTVTGIAGNSDGNIILSSPSGIATVSLHDILNESDNLHVQWINRTNTKGLLNDVFTCITNAPNHNYWMGTNTNMVVNYNSSTREFKSFPLKRSNPQHQHFTVTNITIIEYQLIISTIGHGIYILDTETGNISNIAHQPSGNTTISHKDVHGVTKDIYGDYWVATWDGLDQLQELTSKTQSHHYNWDHPLFKDQLENRMISILSDPSGVIWVGTHGGGVVKINLEKQFFNRIRFNSLYEVKGFASDSQNNLYTALYHGGIKKTTLPLTAGESSYFEQFSTNGSGLRHIPTDIILSSVTDEAGNIWFGTIESSLLYYQPSIDKISEIKVKPQKSDNWSGRIDALLIDRQGRFWLGTGNGLILYDRDNHIFNLTQQNNKVKYQLSGNHIRALLEDHDGNIWVGTNRGLNKLIYQQGHTFRFNHFNDLHTSSYLLENNEIWALHQMPDGHIWIGYRSALGYYDDLQSTIHFLTKREGLCHNFVTCLTHHADSILWIGTNSGISRLNTKNLSFTNYYIANNIRAAFKARDGQLIFGNNKGLLYFYPDSITKRDFNTPVYITDIQVQNRPVHVNETVNDRIVLTQAAPYTSSIELYHPINNLAINYVGLSYLNQKSNQYKYRLSGFENKWNQVDGTQRSVTYNNLKPGSYTFEVQAANCDGIWSKETAHINIIIHPAWYASWWGRTILIIITLSILLGIYWYRMKQLYKAKDLELQSKELEHELNIARIERDKEHELAEIKSRFFTNISHELRTPLTLIMAPVKDLIKEASLPLFAKSKLETVNQQAQHLYELISQLLDLRKIEVGHMKLQASSNAIGEFSEQIVNHFMPFAQHRGVKLAIDKPQVDTVVWFDTGKLQIALSNLISNAIKFSPEKELVLVSIKCDESKCYISVKDRGQGIPKAEQTNIFKRFYQLKQQSVAGVSGSGVGLSLAREFVQLHHGSLSVNSAPGQGAEFTIMLPLGDTHLSADEKVESGLNKLSFTAHSSTDSSTKTNIQKTNSTNKKVLLAEDHQQLREYMHSLLGSHYSIQSATNGKEALWLAKNEEPDLIISDIMMPEMDGYQLCGAIKKDENLCHIPVILLTAKSAEKDIIEGLETGADDYITKPFTPEILLAKIENLLKRGLLLRKYYSQKLTLTASEIEIEPHQEQFIRQAIEVIEQNLTNPLFNAVVLAESLNMSQPTLYRRIKTFTGDNIATFIRSIRIRHAAQLLKSGNYTVSETALQVGLNDTAYFRKCFVQQFGVNPSKYKDNH